MKEFKSVPVASSIAEQLYNILLDVWCPLDKNEFVPHLLDDVAEDYGIVDLDLEELLFELLGDYDLPKKDIKGSDKEIVTVKDLIKFAIAVTQSYPLKSAKSKETDVIKYTFDTSGEIIQSGFDTDGQSK